VHFDRARGLLAAGKVSAAMKEVRTCLRLLPGDLDVPLYFVPALSKLGRTAEADEVFAAVFDLYDGLTRDWPGWALGHNQLAWLCARCRRKLDQALPHAEKAAALEPGQAGYLDTLAEVHFQRGDRDRAVAVCKKCVSLEPKNDYYHKQLKRFQAGDPRADLPDRGR
jgi:tetratricopeptide (TPR) repeat protein